MSFRIKAAADIRKVIDLSKKKWPPQDTGLSIGGGPPLDVSNEILDLVREFVSVVKPSQYSKRVHVGECIGAVGDLIKLLVLRDYHENNEFVEKLSLNLSGPEALFQLGDILRESKTLQELDLHIASAASGHTGDTTAAYRSNFITGLQENTSLRRVSLPY